MFLASEMDGTPVPKRPPAATLCAVRPSSESRPRLGCLPQEQTATVMLRGHPRRQLRVGSGHSGRFSGPRSHLNCAGHPSANQPQGTILPVSVFGAVSTTVMFGDFLSGGLVLFASLFMVFEISLEIERQEKGKK